MKNVALFLTVVLSIGLSGCSMTMAPAEIRESNEEFSGAFGQIAGSIASVTAGELKNGNSFSRLFFQSIDDETKGVITWGASQIWDQERDFETSDREGSIFLLQLPVGEYEIYNFQFYWNGGMAERSYTSADGLAIPFRVNENEITYLGEFLAWGRRAKNVFGMSIVAGGSFTWEGRPERDYELIYARYPEFDANKAKPTDLSAYFPPPELVKILNVPSE
tara:strand:+ start:1818 stop:2477 length:660 start_codon:yes stop_codon:yes gene_type:complete